MKINLGIGALLAALLAPPAMAADETPTMELSGTIRDFKLSHPDFEKQMPAPFNYFFPINDKGFGPTKYDPNKPFKFAPKVNQTNNFHFTFELATAFRFVPLAERDLNGDGVKGGSGDHLVFTFTGDDDLWVYINDRLAVDLGGVHSQERGTLNLDTGEFKRYGADGKPTHTVKNLNLGLQPGRTSNLHLFFAERCTTESNFRIETTLQFLKPTALYD